MPDLDVGLAYLARRCHPDLAAIWADEWAIRTARQLWLSVLLYHIECGVVPDIVYWQYSRVAVDVDLESIKRRERTTRHDVKAWIEELCALAGGLEYIHLGMTSADVVDNLALIRIKWSVELLAAVHGRPELAAPLASLGFRGIRGPVGTMQDQQDLLGAERALELDRRVARRFGFDTVQGGGGQIYPRSLELCLSHLAGAGLRAPWSRLVVGYLGMLAACAGDQWNEGDVSSSVVRRVALPGLMMATELGLRTD